MKAAVITFPGSNCDRDMQFVLQSFFNIEAKLVWHAEQFSETFDLVVLPGGFSYGDYLRTGAIARFAAAMKSVTEHVKRGAPVIGICNGFQILCEAGLLPGVLMRNRTLKHICKDVPLRARASTFMQGPGEETLWIPVSHGDGNYQAPEDTLKELEDNRQIAFEYLENVNGSARNIAGITDRAGRVLGMMPHPERAVDPLTGGTDGKKILECILNACRAPV